MSCQCIDNNTVEIVGLCNTANFTFASDGSDSAWTEISIPETLFIPCQKPDIEQINKVFINVKIIRKQVVDTPVPDPATTENEEGTLLTGKKLIVEGILQQKIVYTADVPTQSVHAAHFDIPFSTFIILEATDNEEFCIDSCVEDVFVKAFTTRMIFKNVTLFLRARPKPTC